MKQKILIYTHLPEEERTSILEGISYKTFKKDPIYLDKDKFLRNAISIFKV